MTYFKRNNAKMYHALSQPCEDCNIVWHPLEGPIMITHGDDPFTVHGGNPELQQDLSDKQMKVKIRNIDHAYKYFEIAIVRNTSADSYATAPVCTLINRRMLVPTDDTLDIIITGKKQFDLFK